MAIVILDAYLMQENPQGPKQETQKYKRFYERNVSGRHKLLKSLCTKQKEKSPIKVNKFS